MNSSCLWRRARLTINKKNFFFSLLGHKRPKKSNLMFGSFERTKNGLRELVLKSRTIARKRKLLVQHWGGISKVILGTVINVVGSLRLFRWWSNVKGTYSNQKNMSCKSPNRKWEILGIWTFHCLKNSLQINLTNVKSISIIYRNFWMYR